MRDVVFISLVIAFFGLAATYVSACSRIIGADETVPDVTGPVDDVHLDEEAA